MYNGRPIVHISLLSRLVPTWASIPIDAYPNDAYRCLRPEYQCLGNCENLFFGLASIFDFVQQPRLRLVGSPFWRAKPRFCRIWSICRSFLMFIALEDGESAALSTFSTMLHIAGQSQLKPKDHCSQFGLRRLSWQYLLYHQVHTSC